LTRTVTTYKYSVRRSQRLHITAKRRSYSTEIRVPIKKKSKKGAKPPPPKDKVRKRYRTTAGQPGLCQVRIKVTRTVNKPTTVTVERLDAEQHQHDLARSREIAPGDGRSIEGISTGTSCEYVERSQHTPGLRTPDCDWWSAYDTERT